jgi:phosphate-selective porin OprO/OprP
MGPFSVQTEWTYNRVDGGQGQSSLNFWGGYAFASWFLTGEHRNYDHGKGRFNRVRPAANFNPAKGDWGAWELAARYSYLDLDDQNVSGGKLWDVTVGLNWYLFPNLRWMLNYVHGDVSQRTVFVFDDMGMLTGVVGFNGAANILQTRLALDF